MKRSVSLVLLLALTSVAAAKEPPKPMVTGLANPTSVCVGPGPAFRVFVATAGKNGEDGEGAVMVVEPGGKTIPFVTGLHDPAGIAVFQKWLFVANKNKVLRIDATAKQPKAEVFAAADKFPVPPAFLSSVAVDVETGMVYVTDAGKDGKGGAVYRINPKGGAVSVVVDEKKLPGLKIPNGVVNDGTSFLLLADAGTGILHRIKLADGSSEKVADGLDAAAGLTWDWYGRLYVSSWNKTGKLFVIPRPGEKPRLVVEGFQLPTGICLDPTGKFILVPDARAGTLTAVPAQVPGAEVDETRMPLKTEIAFPDLKWTGWNPETATGKVNPLRPIVLTHAGDGSNRVFVATEHGVVHVFPNDQKATETKIFLDIQDRVQYDDRTNEEGLLGMAFHPKFKENGEVFIYYTPKRKNPKEEMTNVVARFRLAKGDPTKLDPASEELILKYNNRPYWNHDGGTICFGPDGYLYVVHGDGGLGNDPHDNGQNLKAWFGKILRIDVDHKDPGKNYAVPKDNPFVGRDDALPEIWAYGVRNPWRISFDKKTGVLWCGDVGQNLYEEIDLIVKGGNYGWSVREGLHPFSDTGVGPSKDLIDPIWEYDHDTGKCIIGGHVYRGSRVPELDGAYLYADYVAPKLWALRYDESKRRVVANRPLKASGVPVLSFGEDEKGEVYTLEETLSGKGIRWLVQSKEKK